MGSRPRWAACFGDPAEAHRLGEAARERVRAESLGIRLLADDARLIGNLLD
jgi:hypothetical protein